MKNAVLQFDEFIKASHTAEWFKSITGLYKNTGTLMHTQTAHTQVSDMIMALVGLETLAYIRPVIEGAVTGFGVFAADGTQLAVFDSAESAYFTARQNNLQPVSLH